VPVAADAPPRFRRGTDGAEMVLVPAGSFVRGHRLGDASGPQRRVHLGTYLIDVEPVPQEQFARWMGGRGTVLRLERGFFPVQAMPAAAKGLAHAGYVSWFAAREYARWAIPGSGELPTEAQWEKAVRGRTDDRRYPGGDHWVDGARSPYGLAACHLLEWTRDAYDEAAYRLPDLFDPVREAAAGEEADRVVRGRTPDGDPALYGVWVRLSLDPLTAGFTNPIGFRVVVRLPMEEEA
jgi:formylglycine-generating enzyme required for sulfatase activity